MASSTSPLDSRRLLLLEWLVTAEDKREPKTLVALAEKIGVSKYTLRDWKREPAFVKEWRQTASETYGGVEKTVQMLHELEQVWRDRENPRQVQAAKVWHDVTKSISPSTGQISKDELREMTTEALEELLSKKAEDELAKRRAPKASGE